MKKRIYQHPKTESIAIGSCTILCASGGQQCFISISGTATSGYVAD